MATTVGATISRIRNIVKAVKEDSFLTDRFLYSEVLKYGKMLIRRQESINALLKFNSLFKTLPCMDLIEVNKVEACCGGITSDCSIKRTKDKIPGIIEASFGPLFRTVSSIDGSIEIYSTTPSTYVSMTKTTNFRYNKYQYYWFLNGYLYFPNMDWDAVQVEGIFEGHLYKFICPTDPECTTIQDQFSPIPDFLFAEIEKMVLADLGMTIQIPTQPNTDDKTGALRD